MKTYPIRRQNDIVIQELGSEILIYNLKSAKAYCLNETSSLIWRACDGEISFSDLTKQLSRQTKSQVSEEFVFYALEDLQKNELLTHHEAIPQELKGLSRREVIRKVGLASMIALPIISGIVAPTSAQAASSAAACVNPGGKAAGSTAGSCTGTQATCNRTCSTTSFIISQCCSNTATAASGCSRTAPCDCVCT